MNLKLTKVFTDDYETLYVNGWNRYEEHQLDLNTILQDLVGNTITSYKLLYIEPEVIDEVYGGVLPLELADIDKNHLR